jgi:hypothetical protein
VPDDPRDMIQNDAKMALGDDAPPDTPAAGENVCPGCGGTGTIDGRPCANCAGTGTVIKGIGGA